MDHPPSTSLLRYAVLHHSGGQSSPHFDLLLEMQPGSPLAAWRCQSWPIAGQDKPRPLPDHRAIYLDYEGPLSGGRGRVRRVAAGTYQVVARDAAQWAVRLDDGTALRLPRG